MKSTRKERGMRAQRNRIRKRKRKSILGEKRAGKEIQRKELKVQGRKEK